MTTSPRTVTLLGSTGSIGTQAIDVARAASDRFRIIALSAGGNVVGEGEGDREDRDEQKDGFHS